MREEKELVTFLRKAFQLKYRIFYHSNMTGKPCCHNHLCESAESTGTLFASKYCSSRSMYRLMFESWLNSSIFPRLCILVARCYVFEWVRETRDRRNETRNAGSCNTGSRGLMRTQRERESVVVRCFERESVKGKT